MRKILIAVIAMALIAAMILPAGAVFAAAPATFTVNYNQAQFQWRGSAPFGDWSYSYQNDPESSDYTLTGDTLHTSWSFSPVVTDLTGETTIYNFDKKNDVWTEKEGTVDYNYTAGYGDYPIQNYFRGYIKFNGTPNADNFVHGVAYQWVYLLAPQGATLTGPNDKYAQWDSKVGAWLVGFSIYVWDTGSQDYKTPLETVTVPSGSIGGVSSSNVLSSGTPYIFTASGTWANGNPFICDADAEYTSTDNWSTIDDGRNNEPNQLDLQVNNAFVDWGAYSSSHTYSLAYTGTGATVNFRVFDGDPTSGTANPGWYGDNTGSLTVNIYIDEIPFPSTFIEPVPASNYNPLGL